LVGIYEGSPNFFNSFLLTTVVIVFHKWIYHTSIHMLEKTTQQYN
jgi:hypothetical protein